MIDAGLRLTPVLFALLIETVTLAAVALVCAGAYLLMQALR